MELFQSRFPSEPIRFSWVIAGKLAASAKPKTAMQLRWLRKHGIGAVLDLTETPNDLEDTWRAMGANYLKVAMRDHSPPTLAQLRLAVGFISTQLSLGNPVLVHCLGGLGRTGTVLACYLLKSHRISAESAIREIRGTRLGSIEPSQEANILRYSLTVTNTREQNTKDPPGLFVCKAV